MRRAHLGTPSVIQHSWLMLPGCFAEHWRHSLFFKARNPSEKLAIKMIDRYKMHTSFGHRNKAHGLLKHVSACTCCVSSVVLSSTFSFLRPHSVSINFRKIKILCFGDSVLQMNTNKLLIALIYTKQSYMRALNNDSLLGWTAVSARQASSAPLCDSRYLKKIERKKMKF